MEDDKVKWIDNITHEDEIEFKTIPEWIVVKNHNGYKYAERKGVDSVAFVLFDINTEDLNRIGLIKEIKPSINRMMVSAFGGSLDQEHYKDDLRVLVKEEVMEEAGFNVELQDIKFYGKVLVSSQMNQFCYLFGVTVDKKLQTQRTTTNPAELLSEIMWFQLSEISELEDWKAITIVSKKIIGSNSRLVIRPITS